MPAELRFLADTDEMAEQFVREYVVDATERAPEFDGCEGIIFDLAPSTVDESGVRIVVVGDASGFVEHEEPTWEEYRQEGTI